MVSVDLPFCLPTSTSTVRNRKCGRYGWSSISMGSSSRACISSHFCHGSRWKSRAFSENSMTEKPALVSGVRGRSGGVYMRGSVRPYCGISSPPARGAPDAVYAASIASAPVARAVRCAYVTKRELELGEFCDRLDVVRFPRIWRARLGLIIYGLTTYPALGVFLFVAQIGGMAYRLPLPAATPTRHYCLLVVLRSVSAMR